MADPKTPLSREQFVRVAIDFVEKHSMSEFTLRAIGQELGVNNTAIYRHFPSKESLLDAMLESVLGEVAALPDPEGLSPRDCIMQILRNVRQVFQKHSHLSATYVSATGAFPSGLILTRRISAHLSSMGLRGDALVRTYQMLEGYTLGTSVFDAGGAPDTWSIRQERYRYVNSPDFDDAARDPERVQRIAYDGFTRAISLILDDAEKDASR
jgi:AcrR family transcriptional regulator